ncbi:MAG: metal-dependent hydrolase [Methanoregulaceae archaeon]
MNRGVHLVLGGIAFFLYSWVIGNIEPAVSNPFLPGIIAALVGSLAPDCLEPATSWHHRGICHSRRALWFTGILLGLTFAGLVLPVPSGTPSGFPVLWTVSCFFLGYFSHLLADACTKMGLPR